MQQPGYNGSGTIFGFRSFGDWGEYSEGQGAVYYFGRSKQQALRDAEIAADARLQKEALVKRLKFTGLNKPMRIILWIDVPNNLPEVWENFFEHLRGGVRLPVHEQHPEITNHLWVGNNWFSANIGADAFGVWCERVAEREVRRYAEEEQPPVEMIEFFGRAEGQEAVRIRVSEFAEGQHDVIRTSEFGIWV